ncbi:glycerate kinase family protein [Falsibacillus albus]|uniref:Glycerate kinase n=1 Tax=Falsibacillus albus TaxID=2478915 RepID=A0A3L7JVK1_9BACI|nr:glycerate kinase [Falsibacillus albus]RLQ94898.1 glycerate kinase [Falsibacillus albus]
MKKFLIASDSYKGSLSALEVGEAAKKGILSVHPDAEVKISPMADGGEGTIEALLQTVPGKEIEVEVHDPLMRPITAKYAVIEYEGKDVVFIECARSSGLPLVPAGLRNPMNTNSYGLGEQIRDAVRRGYRDIMVSLGGSASNDGGLGMLQALGWELYDSSGVLMGMRGNPLLDVVRMSDENVIPELSECTFAAASDVTNPFFGENGAAHVFAKQKGASDGEIGDLDLGLRKLAGLYEKTYGVDVQDVAGAGAAGGLGGAIVAALRGQIASGVDTVIELTRLEEKVEWADVVFTGEGSLDNQSVMGKVPVGVGKLAKRHGKKVIGIAGRIDTELNEVNKHLDGVFSIQTECRTLEEAMEYETAAKQVEVTVGQIVRVI